MSDLQCQPWITRPTAKLINNGVKVPLMFQCAAVAAETACLEAALKAQTTASSTASSPSSSPSPLAVTAITQQSSDTNKETDSDDQEFTPSKHQIISDSESSDEDGSKQRKRQKKKLKGNGM